MLHRNSDTLCCHDDPTKFYFNPIDGSGGDGMVAMMVILDILIE